MNTLDDKIKKLCGKLNVPEPIEFLTQIMGGHDPRRLSDIYQMILTFEEAYGESVRPDEWDYIELVETIKEKYTYSPVLLSESHAAAKQIIEYTHAKKKQVEHSGNVSGSSEITPLTSKEIRLFRRKFNRDY